MAGLSRLQKSWIFVSHSNRDLEAVRRIRNEIEDRGGQPLLFFLKCLSDGDELDDLLKREIEARRYFLLCDSEHAASSKWVKEEVDYVTSLSGKRVENIDLRWNWNDQVEGVQRLLKQATLFPVYAQQDRPIVEALLRELGEHDFGIFDAFGSVEPQQELGSAINGAIDSSQHLLHFLSPSSVESQWCRLEAEYFLRTRENRRYYIPVLLDRAEVPETYTYRRPDEILPIDFSSRDIGRFVAALEDWLYS